MESSLLSARNDKFEPFRYPVPDPHDVGDTPLNSNFWTDEDFEEIDEEIDEEEAGFG
jgi:hypothetical protein